MRYLPVLVAFLLFCPGAGAVPYHEWRNPSGPAKGLVLVIHGGGWAGGAEIVRDPYVEETARRFNRWDWRTLSIDYRTATPDRPLIGYKDIRAFYFLARRSVSSRKPICVWGSSAGGHYALLLHRDVHTACALVEGAPTDLQSMPPRMVMFLHGRFGDMLSLLSPMNYAQDYGPNVATAISSRDKLVPRATQGRPFVRRTRARGFWPRAQDGGCPFTHTGITCTDKHRWLSLEHSILNRTVGR